MKLPILFLVPAILSAADGWAAEPPVPEGHRIREIVSAQFPEGNVYVGGTTGWKTRPKGSGVILDREFSYVTPENDFKQSTIHPEPGEWNWEPADNWVEQSAREKQLLRIHGPISPQCSSWIEEDDRTPEELKVMMTEFMTELCKRYDHYEHVKWMDVVNETVMEDGSWHGPKKGVDGWECPWTAIGFDQSHPLNPPLYIKLAFEIANRHAPNTEQIINQHGGMEEAPWEKIKALVLYLRERNLRVNGIGWQAHVYVGWEKEEGNLERLGALIDWAHQHKLSFHITEQNVWLTEEERSLEAQAATFAAIMKVLLEKRESGEVTWNVWNISDRDAWRQDQMQEGCLFDRNYQAKPAYYALQKLLENPPGTR